MKPKSLLNLFVVVAFLGLASTSARADDTEIFFNQSNANVGANVMLILDTSGSMDDEVTSAPDYDASTTYPTTGSCDPAYVYWGSSGTPSCGSSNRVPVTQFKCASAATQLGNTKGATGQYGDAFIRWGKVTTGTGKKKSTVYQWTKSLTVSSGSDVECLGDAGVDGDGTNVTNLWPTKNSDPASVNGIWSSASDSWWAIYGNTGTSVTFYSANYINYVNDAALYVTQTKIKIMQDAVKQLLNSVSGVNVGLMRYDYKGVGGMITNAIAPIASNATPITNMVNSWAAAGNTPLVKTLYEAYLYFAGGSVNFGNTSYSTTCNSTYTNGNGAIHCGSMSSFRFNSVAASRTGGSASSNTYDSPADLSCQKNYVIFLTDGQSNNNDTAINSVIKALPSFSTLGGACDAAVMPGAAGGQCLGALSQYMNRSDLRNDVAGTQNVTTYYIGFGDTFKTDPNATAYYNYLNDAATRGGGKAFTATSLTELQSVFSQIFNEVQNINTSFSAPSVAVNAFNRTQTLDDLYVSVFKPSDSYHWPGNVKKYKVVNGQITDAVNPTLSAVDPSTGFFRSNAQSFWSTVVDGADVTKGGAASMLPIPSNRVLYTWLGANPGSPAGLVPLASASDTDFNIGGSGDPARADLLNWAMGQDVQDDNNDGSTTDQRFVMGDPIHAQPAVVIYGTGPDDTWLFTPTNDGYLHAFNARTGVEQWAYLPQDLLNKLKLLYADDASPVKHYGLDGQVTLIKYDVNGDGSIDPANGDRVLLYFGTGRNADVQAYYAIDVTNPNAPKFMWKLTPGTLPDLGQAWSTPQVARVNINGATQNSQKLVLIMGGGYDPSEDGYTYVPADAVGNHIYMVDALYGSLLWSVGNSTSTSTLKLPRMTHSFPSSVTVLDTNGDGYADRMYVGDMAAQLWRFDIYNGQTALNLVAGGVMASLGTKDDVVHSAANTRRFYSAPDVAAIQLTGQPTFMNIAIGSGYRGHPLDSGTVDRLYSVRDYNAFTALTQAAYTTGELPANLIVDATLQDITSAAQSVVPVPYGSKGWKLVLNTHASGEKVLVPARTFNDDIFFTTYTPTIQASADPCEGVGSGQNRSYIISVFNGAAAIDRNHDSTLSVDERSSDLSQGGIAPETTFLFPAPGTPDPNGNGNGGPNGGSRGPVVCLQGVEVLNACTNYDRRRKTYWREGSAQ